MKRQFTLEYWIDDSWYVGKLKEVPGVFSQGATLNELEENIQDAYSSMLEEDLPLTNPGMQVKDIVLEGCMKRDKFVRELVRVCRSVWETAR